MIYEMRYYSNKQRWNNEDDSGVIVWETEGKKPDSNIAILGKLIFVAGCGKKYTIPDGVEVIGAGAFYKSEWDYFDCPVENLVIPASVQKIEEGEFEFTYISKIQISKDSPAGIIKNKALYTKDESTLLWVLEANLDEEYIVPGGTKRIGRGAVDMSKVSTLILPSSVEEIYYNDREYYQYDGLTIKAPADSFAAEFAKHHGIPFEAI